MNRSVLSLGAALSLALGFSRSASACSLCIAHATGGGLFGIGAQKLPRHRLLFAVSHLGFSKSNGTDIPGTVERENYHQTSLEGLYGLNDRLMLRVSLPQVTKSVTAGTNAPETVHGLGDAIAGLTYQIPPKTGQKFLTALSLDVKLPTGANNAVEEGVRREEHLQLGTGSTDVTLGIDVTGEAKTPGDLWFGGLRERVNGKNGRGYHYGDVTLYSAGYAHALPQNTQVVLEFNGRIAGKDRTEDGSRDENSGGHLGYAAASVRKSLGGGLGAIATIQQPVLKHLHGTQDEKAVFTLSLTRSF